MPKASCLRCAKATAKLEGYAARRIFLDIRIEHGFPTRRPKERPTHLPLIESFLPSPERAPIRLVPAKDYPGMLMLPVLQPPGIVRGRGANVGSKGTIFIANITSDDRQERLKEKGIAGKMYREIRPDYFLRFLAKIATGFAVAALGLDGFVSTVANVILRHDDVMRRDTNPFFWAG